jgi:hypothetical protein
MGDPPLRLKPQGQNSTTRLKPSQQIAPDFQEIIPNLHQLNVPALIYSASDLLGIVTTPLSWGWGIISGLLSYLPFVGKFFG